MSVTRANCGVGRYVVVLDGYVVVLDGGSERDLGFPLEFCGLPLSYGDGCGWCVWLV